MLHLVCIAEHQSIAPHFVNILHKPRNGEDMHSKNNRAPNGRIIGSAELRQLVPFSDSYFWRLEKAGLFPRRIKVGNHRIGWALEEVVAWIEARKSERGRT